MRRSLLYKMVFASLLFSAPALAAEPTRRMLRMRYSEDPRAASCPGEAALREQIQLRTGYNPFRDDAPEEVAVAIGPRGGDLVATVQYHDADGKPSARREFDVPNSDAACGVLTEYVALSITFTLTPFAIDRTAPAAAPPAPDRSPPPPAPDRSPPPPAPDRSPPPQRPASAPERPWGPSQIGAGGLAGVGELEGMFGGASWFFRIRWPGSWSFSLEARSVLVASPRRAVIQASGDGAGQGASSPSGGAKNNAWRAEQLLAGALDSCFHTSHLLVGCGVLEVGVLHLADPSGRSAHLALLLVALGLSGGVEIALGDTLSLYTRAELLAAITPHGPPSGEISRTPRLTASIGAGVLTGF